MTASSVGDSQPSRARIVTHGSRSTKTTNQIRSGLLRQATRSQLIEQVFQDLGIPERLARRNLFE